MRRLLTLLAGLPSTSQLAAELAGTTPEEVWTVERELLAQSVELASIIATPRAGVRSPVKVPRPSYMGKREQPKTVAEAARRLLAAGRGGLVVAK